MQFNVKKFNQSLFIGKKVIKLRKHPSSNVYLKQLIKKSTVTEGTVISVLNQTNGTGQRGNTWESMPDKNVACSILLKPTFLPTSSQFIMNIAISIALQKCISQFVSQNVFIKWPNDIYVEKKKIAGTLIENIISHKSITETIIGIGINTNQESFQSSTAVSFFNLLNVMVDNEQVMILLFSFIEHYYMILKQGNYALLWQQYYDNLLGYHVQKQYTLRDGNGEPFIGEILEITKAGQLVLKVGSSVKYFNFQEVRMVA